MKRIILSIICVVLMTASLSGCKCTKGRCGNDNKPVAPESYSNEHGDLNDPVLKPMDLWWK